MEEKNLMVTEEPLLKVLGSDGRGLAVHEVNIKELARVIEESWATSLHKSIEETYGKITKAVAISQVDDGGVWDETFIVALSESGTHTIRFVDAGSGVLVIDGGVISLK